MATVRTVSADAHLARFKGDVLKDDKNLLWWEFIELHGLYDSLATEIHEGGWLHEKDLLAIKAALTDKALEERLIAFRKAQTEKVLAAEL